MSEGTKTNMFDAIEVVEEAIEIGNDNQWVFSPTNVPSGRPNSANAWRIQENAAR